MGRLRQWRSMLARTHNSLSNEALAELIEGWLETRVKTEALASLLIAKGLITGTELEQHKDRQATFLDWVFETQFAGFRAADRGVQVTNAALAHETMARLAERERLAEPAKGPELVTV